MTDAQLDALEVKLSTVSMEKSKSVPYAQRMMLVDCRFAVRWMRRELASALAAQATTQDALNRLSARHAVVLQELEMSQALVERLEEEK